MWHCPQLAMTSHIKHKQGKCPTDLFQTNLINKFSQLKYPLIRKLELACAKLKQTKIKTKNNHLTSTIWLILSLFYKALKEGLKDSLPQGQRTQAGELLY